MTIFKIAHDMKTMMDAQRILFFKEGEIIGDGDHKKLLTENPYYKRHFIKNYK